MCIELHGFRTAFTASLLNKKTEKDRLHLALQTTHVLFCFFLSVSYSGLLHNSISVFARLLITLYFQHSK